MPKTIDNYMNDPDIINAPNFEPQEREKRRMKREECGAVLLWCITAVSKIFGQQV